MNKRVLRYILMFIFMFIVADSYAQINNWQDLYKTKKKDTIYGIAKKYGITVEELMEANPEMKGEGYQLKKGDTVFIPFPAKTQKTPSVVPVLPNAATDIRSRAIKIGIMLPLHQVDGDGQRMTEYYRGFLLACDKLKQENISVDIHAWNVDNNANIRQTLLDKNAESCDIIFGPLYSNQVKLLADFCKTYKIRLVIPFSINSDEVKHNAQVFQVYQSPKNLNQKAIAAFMERFPHHHPIFVDCNDSTSKKGIFTFGLRKQLEAKGIKYSITNIKSSEEMFAKAFSRTEPNVVILNSGRSPELNVALAKLNGLKAILPTLEISLYGYTEWLMYTKYNLANFYKFDTYIPTTFYYNPLATTIQQIETAYRRWFKSEPLQALPRFALVGYDHAMFFLNGLHKYGASFSGTKKEVVGTCVQSPLYFVKNANGGMENACFQLIHYKPNQTIDSVTY